MASETKLKVAAEEIKDILRKHDIAGAVALHTPGHGEFINHILTSYSCAYQYEDNSVRFYSKKEDYSSPEEQHKQQESTANMLSVLKDLVGYHFLMLETLSERFDKIVDAKHF